MEYKILMVGTATSVKGGMTSVARNYIDHAKGENYEIRYIPDYITASKPIQIAYFIYRYFQIFSLLAFGKYDMVHLHTTEKGSTIRKGLISCLARLFNVPYIIHLHLEYRQFYDSLPRFAKLIVRKFFQKSACNIMLSEDMAGCIREIAPDTKICVIPNGVNVPNENPYNPQAQNVLFLGCLCDRKGIWDVLECIKKLDSTLDKDVKFMLCGDGEIEKVKRKIELLEISHRISHIGWINEGEKQAIFKSSALNILPSYQEGLPMTILETMAYGIPNISTNISGIPSIIHDGENGLLIEPGDVDALADKIAKLMSNDKLRQKFSENAYNLIKQKYSISQMIDKTEAIYETVVRGI